MQLRPLSVARMEANHARAKARELKLTKSPQVVAPWNIQTVLDLGNLVVFLFRGRAYGMPPLPWKAGQKLLALWLKAKAVPSPITEQSAPEYYATLAKITTLLWRYSYPMSRPLRILRWLGLARNPWSRATEQEIVEFANFFLSRRMKSGGSPAPVRVGKYAVETL